MTTTVERVTVPEEFSYWRRGGQLLEFRALAREGEDLIYVFADVATEKKVRISEEEFETLESVEPEGDDGDR